MPVVYPQVVEVLEAQVIPPRAERRRSKVYTLTAWQAAFFILLAMTVTLVAIAYAHIAGLRAQLIELKNVEVICPKSTTGRAQVVAEIIPLSY